MRKALTKLFEFIGKANSEGPNPSSTRMNVFIITIQWSIIITIGFGTVLIYFKDLIIPYLSIVIGGLLTVLGIKAAEKVKTNKPEAKDEITN